MNIRRIDRTDFNWTSIAKTLGISAKNVDLHTKIRAALQEYVSPKATYRWSDIGRVLGRMTLNVLLSFAQFEREVIGERVRDKIAASKRKGLWMGGPVPLGYANMNKKLVIVDDEAETIRIIFKRYLELGSIQALATELGQTGVRTKERIWSDNRTVGGVRFQTGPLAYLLKNRVYIGEVAHKGNVFQADHDAIIDRELFEAVQEKLKLGAVARTLKLRSNPASLTGRIYDDQGNRMSPSHTRKKGVRYRYYVSHAVLHKGVGKPGTVTRVPAVEIEQLVERVLQNDPDVIAGAAELNQVVIVADAIKLYLTDTSDGEGEGAERVLSLPWLRPVFTARKGIAHVPSGDAPSEMRHDVLAAIAKARSWLEDLIADRTTIAEIARRENRVERHIRLLLVLGSAAPALVEALAGGSATAGITVTGLAQALEASWGKQVQSSGERLSGVG